MLSTLTKYGEYIQYTDNEDDLQTRYEEELGELMNQQFEMLMEEELGLIPQNPIRYATKAGVPLPEVATKEELLDYLTNNYPECIV